MEKLVYSSMRWCQTDLSQIGELFGWLSACGQAGEMNESGHWFESMAKD